MFHCARMSRIFKVAARAGFGNTLNGKFLRTSTAKMLVLYGSQFSPKFKRPRPNSGG